MSNFEDFGLEDWDFYEELMHEGVLERSGRFPWGSGEHPFQRLGGIYNSIARLRKEGFSEKEIAEHLGVSQNKIRARLAYMKEVKKFDMISKCAELRGQGLSNIQIGKKLGINESSVRGYLSHSEDIWNNQLFSTMRTVREKFDSKDSKGNPVQFIDIGKGVERHMGVSNDCLSKVVSNLEDEGYNVYSDLRIKTGPERFTTVKVIAKPGVTKKWCLDNFDQMGEITDYSEDGGKSFKKIQPPTSIDLKRVTFRYADDDKNGQGDGISGVDRDGLIEIRRGCEDLNLGNARYAQVRIAVDGQYYLKGMAVYADDLPDGVDIRFNTNKPRAKGPYEAMKPMKTDDPENPFGSAIKDADKLKAVQRTYVDSKTGEEKLSALNIVNEEGNWEDWSRTVAHQMLSKQDYKIARQQLKIDSDSREKRLTDIMALTNPVLKAKLLEDYANNCDSAAVHMKAASFPRQATHVILPMPHLKENEIYAPNYEQGEEVILIRYPHAGVFEIPRLTVNNNSRIAKKTIGTDAKDAVGINPKAAEQLSGADFDGDTVLVIPTKGFDFKTAAPLEGLKNFDPKTQYAVSEEDKKSGRVKTIKSDQYKGIQMGMITNLITDMNISGMATEDELARAVRHSMVVIDAKKHGLNYKQSEKDNGIAELRAKYQPATPDHEAGKAGTIFSRAKNTIKVPNRKTYTHTDPETGEKIFINDPQFKKEVKKRKNPETGKEEYYETGRMVEKMRESTQMAETRDAYTLTSGGSKEHPGTQIEAIYADYANHMKALANRARKEILSLPDSPISPSAKKTYERQVASLDAKVKEAQKRAPLERKARAATQVDMARWREDNPEAEGDAMKKAESRFLKRNRQLYGMEKQDFSLSDREWEAIQAGAVSKTRQKEIFRYCDQDRLLELALPKDKPAMSRSDISRAKSLLKRGYTSAEVAKLLGVSTTTLHNYIEGES